MQKGLQSPTDQTIRNISRTIETIQNLQTQLNNNLNNMSLIITDLQKRLNNVERWIRDEDGAYTLMNKSLRGKIKTEGEGNRMLIYQRQ